LHHLPNIISVVSESLGLSWEGDERLALAVSPSSQQSHLLVQDVQDFSSCHWVVDRHCECVERVKSVSGGMGCVVSV